MAGLMNNKKAQSHNIEGRAGYLGDQNTCINNKKKQTSNYQELEEVQDLKY